MIGSLTRRLRTKTPPGKFVSSVTELSSRRDSIVMVKILSPLAALVIIAAYFNEFVQHAIEANVAINGLITSTAIYGVTLIISRLFSAQRDFQVIERFGNEARAGVPMNLLLEEPWIKYRYVRHYLKHIAQTEGTLSSSLDQNAIESELHALEGEYNSKLELPQFLVGFMIALGLLGTFIGLLETLTGIASMLDGMGGGNVNVEQQFMSLVGELRKPLAGMGIAFSASMFGLITSLMLAIMMINLRRYISRVILCARNVMHDLTEISRKHHGEGTASALVIGQHVGPGAEGVAGDNAAQATNILVANRVDMLVKKLDILFKSFETSISGTNRLNDLLGYGPRMKETGERSLEEMRALTTGTVEQHRLTQQIVDIQANTLNIINALLETQRRAQVDFSNIMKGLSERLGRLEETNISSGRHLWDIKENLMKFGGSSDIIEAISSSLGHQTLLLQELLNEARDAARRQPVPQANDL